MHKIRSLSHCQASVIHRFASMQLCSSSPDIYQTLALVDHTPTAGACLTSLSFDIFRMYLNLYLACERAMYMCMYMTCAFAHAQKMYSANLLCPLTLKTPHVVRSVLNQHKIDRDVEETLKEE